MTRPRNPKPLKLVSARTTNPWDVPPFPDAGDASAEAVYVSVGRALSSWEEFESKLIDVFAFAIGVDWDHWYAAARAYGAIATFRGRMDMIAAALEACAVTACWVPQPPQLEDESRKLFHEAVSYSARRNEIAHGIVRAYGTDAGPGFALFPASYISRKHTPDDHGIDCPNYAYTSVEIDSFGELFKSLVPRTEYVGGLIQQWLASSQKRSEQPYQP